MLQKDENSVYIRGSGEATIMQDEETKKSLENEIPDFKDHWQSMEDPNHTLLEIGITEIEYLKPGPYRAQKLSL